MQLRDTFGNDGAAFEVGNDLDSLESTGNLVDGVSGVLLVFVVANNLVVLGLVSLPLLGGHWAEALVVLVNSSADDEEELKRVSAVGSLGENKPGRESVDLVRLKNIHINICRFEITKTDLCIDMLTSGT